MKWFEAKNYSPDRNGWYYCNVMCLGIRSKTLVEWTDAAWNLGGIQHFGGYPPGAKVSEWLDEKYQELTTEKEPIKPAGPEKMHYNVTTWVLLALMALHFFIMLVSEWQVRESNRLLYEQNAILRESVDEAMDAVDQAIRANAKRDRIIKLMEKDQNK